MTATLEARPAGHHAAARRGAHPAALARSALRVLPRLLVDLGLVAALLAFLGLAVGPHVLGYRTMTMLTGSMAPLIEPGDVTVVTPVRPRDVTPGMIVSYQIPVDDHRVVSHRVVTATPGADGGVTLQTKGDANPGNDPWTATVAPGETAWQVRGVVPGIGTAIRVLRTPVLSQVLVHGVPVVLAGWVLLSVWAPRRGGRVGREQP